MAFDSNSFPLDEAPPEPATALGREARDGEVRAAPATLADLPVGARAEICDVQAPEPIGTRLRDLGFVPGTEVRCERRAPLGDPSVYRLRGTRLCLRRSEARGIRVRPLG